MKDIMRNPVEAKRRWEKYFQKKMTDDEFTMFNWGYTYAINDMIEVQER